jgi:DNA (cytosine-5)-methyltransferase 1
VPEAIVPSLCLTAIDLFAGAGGATQGLTDAGFRVLGAVENDRPAANSYSANHPEVELWRDDIRKVAATEMMSRLGLDKGQLSLLKACPPCQGFSSLAEGRAAVDARRNDLVLDTIRFVRQFRPRAVMVENVRGLGRDARARTLTKALHDAGYVSKQYDVNAVQFGVPQRRKRLIVLALRGRRQRLPDALPAEGLDAPVSVETAFDQLATALNRVDDPLNVSRTLSDVVRKRVVAVPIGGNRFDLPIEHQLDCHKRIDGRKATASYGRMKLGEPAPTMTTRCTTVACGTFIHPTEHRGITLREAAALQTFPFTYKFVGGYDQIERQIGNAVPVLMAASLGRVVADCLRSTGGNS